MRLYSPERMKKLTKDLQALDYALRNRAPMQVRGISGGLPYLIGRPFS
jgi:hypothetical protein